MESLHNGKLDRWGIFWSLTCTVHCLAIPVVAFFAPVLSEYLKHELFHWVLFLIVFPVVIFALWRPRKHHKSNIPVTLGSIGLLMLVIGLSYDFLAGKSHIHGTDHAESIVTIIGSFFLIAAHFLNLKLHKQCCHHHPGHHEHEHDHHHHHDH